VLPAHSHTGLVVTAQAGQLTLSWQDNSTNETAFLIERSLPNDVCEFTQIAEVEADAEVFVDASLAAGSRWCYRVRATAGELVSLYSNVQCGTVLADPGGDPQVQTATFTRSSSSVSPFSVAVGAYACVYVFGGTSELRIMRGPAIVVKAAANNPPKGVPLAITCALTAASVTFALDGVVKATAPVSP
jgi:hypothetical protein